jgi:hypothetical protein
MPEEVDVGRRNPRAGASTQVGRITASNREVGIASFVQPNHASDPQAFSLTYGD